MNQIRPILDLGSQIGFATLERTTKERIVNDSRGRGGSDSARQPVHDLRFCGSGFQRRIENGKRPIGKARWARFSSSSKRAVKELVQLGNWTRFRQQLRQLFASQGVQTQFSEKLFIMGNAGQPKYLTVAVDARNLLQKVYLPAKIFT